MVNLQCILNCNGELPEKYYYHHLWQFNTQQTPWMYAYLSLSPVYTCSTYYGYGGKIITNSNTSIIALRINENWMTIIYLIFVDVLLNCCYYAVVYSTASAWELCYYYLLFINPVVSLLGFHPVVIVICSCWCLLPSLELYQDARVV